MSGARQTRSGADQPVQPDAGLPVAGDEAGGGREPGVGGPDGHLLPAAAAFGGDSSTPRRRNCRPTEVADRVRELDPVLAAVVVYGHQPSASTQIMTAAGQVCTAIKEASPDQPVLLVGGHVAALPEQTLREEDADFVAAGEGLHTLVGLVEALKTPAPDFGRSPRPLVS